MTAGSAPWVGWLADAVQTASLQVVADFFDWALLALVLALAAYGFLWRRDPVASAEGPAAGGLPGHRSIWTSRVQCERSDVIDGVVALGLVVLFRQLVHASAAPTHGTEVTSMSGRELLSGAFFSFLLGGAVLFYIGVLRQRNLVEWFGLRRQTPGRALAWALGFIIPGFFFVLIVANVISTEWLGPLGFEDTPQEIVQAFTETSNPLFRIFVAITACALAPVVEEATFRGFLYPVFRRFTDGPFAAIFTGLVFGLVHQHLGGFLPLAVLGIFLVISYEMSGSLLVPILAHAIFNTTSVVLMWTVGPTLRV